LRLGIGLRMAVTRNTPATSFARRFGLIVVDPEPHVPSPWFQRSCPWIGVRPCSNSCCALREAEDILRRTKIPAECLKDPKVGGGRKCRCPVIGRKKWLLRLLN